MRKASRIVGVSICMLVIIIGYITIHKINQPVVTDLREGSLYSADEWTTISVNDKYIKRRTDIVNYAESDGELWAQVIDEKGGVIIEPQVLEIGHGKVLTRNWDISNNRYIVQVKATQEGAKYKLGVMHSLSK